MSPKPPTPPDAPVTAKAEKSSRDQLEAERSQAQTLLETSFPADRAGNHFIFDGKRVHEGDLSEDQRTAVGLPKKEA